MKPAKFDYVQPRDVADAVKLLSSHQNAKILAGGQSLGPMLNLRLVRVDLLVDISRLEELRAVEEKSEFWRIGAAVTHATLEDDGARLNGIEALGAIARGIAYRAIRNRGTIGGSLVHADPAADWPLALATLGASVLVKDTAVKAVKVVDLIKGTFLSDIGPDQIVIAIDIPKYSASSRFGYYKFCRKVGEFAEASAACLFDPELKIARVFAGALGGPARLLPQLSMEVARKGIAGLTTAAMLGDLKQVLLNATDAEFSMHLAAVGRAIRKAFAA